jgi:hypothetical protein
MKSGNVCTALAIHLLKTMALRNFGNPTARVISGGLGSISAGNDPRITPLALELSIDGWHG